MMKRFAFAFACSLLATSALAEPVNFTGFFASAFGGYAKGTVGSEDIGEISNKGSIFGAEIGARGHIGNLITGAAIDSLFGNITGTYDDSSGVSVSHKTSALYSARAIIGLPIENFLFYATGGIAASQGKATISALGFNFPAKANHIGFVAGGGVEVLLDKNWSLKSEYRYYGFQNAKYTFDLGGLDASTNVRAKEQLGLFGAVLRW